MCLFQRHHSTLISALLLLLTCTAARGGVTRPQQEPSLPDIGEVQLFQNDMNKTVRTIVAIALAGWHSNPGPTYSGSGVQAFNTPFLFTRSYLETCRIQGHPLSPDLKALVNEARIHTTVLVLMKDCPFEYSDDGLVIPFGDQWVEPFKINDRKVLFVRNNVEKPQVADDLEVGRISPLAFRNGRLRVDKGSIYVEDGTEARFNELIYVFRGGKWQQAKDAQLAVFFKGVIPSARVEDGEEHLIILDGILTVKNSKGEIIAEGKATNVGHNWSTVKAKKGAAFTYLPPAKTVNIEFGGNEGWECASMRLDHNYGWHAEDGNFVFFVKAHAGKAQVPKDLPSYLAPIPPTLDLRVDLARSTVRLSIIRLPKGIFELFGYTVESLEDGAYVKFRQGKLVESSGCEVRGATRQSGKD